MTSRTPFPLFLRMSAALSITGELAMADSDPSPHIRWPSASLRRRCACPVWAGAWVVDKSHPIEKTSTVRVSVTHPPWRCRTALGGRSLSAPGALVFTHRRLRSIMDQWSTAACLGPGRASPSGSARGIRP